MRIVVLEQFLLDIVESLGMVQQVVAVGPKCFAAGELPKLPEAVPADMFALQPDVILSGARSLSDAELQTIRNAVAAAPSQGDRPCAIVHCTPTTLDTAMSAIEDVGKALGSSERAHSLAQRLKAQLMDWCDNFYDRMKNKRVSVLAGVEPLMLAGHWVPDMVALCSGVSHMARDGAPDAAIAWPEIVSFRPDVIVVAPRGMELKVSMAHFKQMEKLPGWESVPAVKRGEVTFVDGLHHFYEPGPKLMESMAILISAIAGLDSGYITPRDSFYRLRWLELQRHRF